MSLWFGAERFAALSEAARASARRRSHFNLHASLDAPAQRLLVAMEPDSYVTPHWHADPSKDETLAVLAGRLGVILFERDGAVAEARQLAPGAAACGLDIPHGVCHSVVSLQSGTVFLEAKAGPYRAAAPEEFAPWAPREGDAGVADYLETLRALCLDANA